MDYAEKTQRCHEYVEALEEERRKIQVFQRELPLCLELVTQAIEACRRELSGTTTEYMHGQSECNSEQTTSSDGTGTLTRTRPLVLEEFMPIKRTNSSSHNDNEKSEDNDNDDEEEEEKEEEKEEDDDQDSHDETNKCIKSDQRKKSEWLRSVQLWNQPSQSDSPLKEDLPRKSAVTEVKRNGGAFQPFHKDKSEKTSVPNTPSSVTAPATSSSTAETGPAAAAGGGNTKKEDKDGQAQRKQRRCWSPELHRRFLHALQQLGGSHAATPKQIRELMKVDGLTNDEVKSHLQKYRLHTRRPSHTIHNNSSNPQAPQFVVVGGIWVPPQEYAAVAATTASGETPTIATTNGIYAPVAALPNHQKQHTQSEHMQSEGRGSHSEGRGTVRSNSPSTSSSTHTTTNSPLF